MKDLILNFISVVSESLGSNHLVAWIFVIWSLVGIFSYLYFFFTSGPMDIFSEDFFDGGTSVGIFFTTILMFILSQLTPYVFVWIIVHDIKLSRLYKDKFKIPPVCL